MLARPVGMNSLTHSAVKDRNNVKPLPQTRSSRKPSYRLLLSGAFLILAGFAFGGCAVSRQVPFNPADFSVMSHKGTAVVGGQVSVDTQDHGTIHPHFQQINLVPVNAYTTENVQRRFLKGERLHSADPRIVNYERSVDTDNDGNFTFRGIPAGDYYLQGEIQWLNTYISTDDQGIDTRLYVSYFKYYFARVTVKDGQVERVTQFDQRNPERHTHYGIGGTTYHPPANVDIFDI